jgi:rhodanese-related sulfurtransferase
VGHRGASAVNLLTEMGFTNVSYVEGGMKKLLAAELATE